MCCRISILTTSCASSPFIYNLAGHIITGDLNIGNSISLQDVLTKGSKYREPESINCKLYLKFLWIPSRIVPDDGKMWKRILSKNQVRYCHHFVSVVLECSLLTLTLKFSSLKPSGQFKPNSACMFLGLAFHIFCFCCRLEICDGCHYSALFKIEPNGKVKKIIIAWSTYFFFIGSYKKSSIASTSGHSII
jgi:hypothetical protein